MADTEISCEDFPEVEQQNLEVFYPDFGDSFPPHEYTTNLINSLFCDDAKLLMETLDTLDLNPWEVFFSEDGLGMDSPDKFNMLVLAERKESWGCVAALTEHWAACRQGDRIMDALQPVIDEYEVTTDDSRRGHLEKFFCAANKGFAENLMEQGDPSLVFHPSFNIGFPKSTRFAYKDFSKYKFERKSHGPIAGKRLSLRQKALAAIADGNVAGLCFAMDCMKANAVAYQTAKRLPYDMLTSGELNAFISVAIGCEYPACLLAILSKVVEFQKALSIAKVVGKLNGGYMKVLQERDKVNLLNEILVFVGLVDQRSFQSGRMPHGSVEKAIEKEIFTILVQEHDLELIEKMKEKSNETLSNLRPCVNQTCDMAESYLEQQQLLKHLAPQNVELNKASVGMPRERVRL